ncbi:MAG: hypothetical protein NC820_07785, partial [Candidatus Omnitrophica bacterium]|nr:hypothetical protein [Candidatus Omnitrophota bacterium]
MIDYKIEFYDKFLMLRRIINKESSINFEWAKNAGCGRFSLILARKFDDYEDVVDFNNMVKIYVNDELWYTGFIENFTPSLSTEEQVNIVGVGYIEQLNWSDTTWVYSNFEISELVKYILKLRVETDKLDIIVKDENFDDTTFSIDQIVFQNQKTKDCIQILRDLVRYYDYGVDEKREFYFKSINQDADLWDVAVWDVSLWERNEPKVWVFPKRYLELYEPIYSVFNHL